MNTKFETLETCFQYTSYIWITQITYSTIKTFITAAHSSFSNLISLAGYFQRKTNITKVLFFPDKNITCKAYLNGIQCKTKYCGYSHDVTSLSVLVETLLAAKHSIDVCVFTISSQDLADILIRKHNEGIIVRIITDYEKMDLNCSQVEQFRSNGIQVRHDKTSYFMHHKYAIIDNQVLINGSFNWTRQAITGNQENLIITEITELVNPYRLQFKKLWNVYKPELYGK